jgi:hypothetical protein
VAPASSTPRAAGGAWITSSDESSRRGSTRSLRAFTASMAFGSPGCTRTDRMAGAVKSTGPRRAAMAGSTSAFTVVSAST